MGLLRIGIDNISNSNYSQFKNIVSCENEDNSILMKRISDLDYSNKLIFKVLNGQMLILYNNGVILDITMETGIYVYEETLEPFFVKSRNSIFLEKLYKGFSSIGFRNDLQCAFFINLNEIKDNKFGTVSPVPYYDWTYEVKNRITNISEGLKIFIKGYGSYSFRIFDLVSFMSRIVNYTDEYKISDFRENLRLDIVDLFQKVLNEMGSIDYKIPFNDIINNNDKILNIITSNSFDRTISDYGIKISSFNIESVSLDEESKKIVSDYEKKHLNTNSVDLSNELDDDVLTESLSKLDNMVVLKENDDSSFEENNVIE